MKLRSKINSLLKAKRGNLQINSVAYLHRWSESGVDHLELCFYPINGVNFKVQSVELKSRYVEGIIVEIKQAFSAHMKSASEAFLAALDQDCFMIGDGTSITEKAAKYDAYIKSRSESGKKSAAHMTSKQRSERARKAIEARYRNNFRSNLSKK